MIETIDIPTSENPIVVPPAPPIKKINYQIIIIAVLSLALVGVSIAYAFNLGKKTTGVVPANIVPTVAITSPIPTTVVSNDEFGTITWLSSPKKIANPNILGGTTPDYGGFIFAELGTYEVASFNNGAKLLVSFILPEGPASPIIFRFVYDNGKYLLIESLISEDYVKKDLDRIFDKNKVKFISYQIKELFPDSYYYVNSINFSKITDGFFLPQFITSIKNYSTVATTPVGDIVSIYSPIADFSDLSMRNYYLILKDFSLIPFNQSSPIGITDNKVPNFIQNDNSQNKNVFGPVRVGCGGGGSISVIKNDSLLSDKTMIGKSGDLQIFQVKNTSSALVKYLYNGYKQGRDYPSAPPIISIDQFANFPNHILYQEKIGDWILLTNPEYSVQAECGKPVVYLYPTTDTTVTVQVGANVTKSEPQYPKNGWTVLAHPNGQLDYQNFTYPNLFWEGTGYGLYPSLGNKGFVIPQSKLISTINYQLRQQGLNDQESKDFMEFWASKLPTTPYTKLTWLTTSEMNILAPLSVSPKPQTTIRVFLDFQGLEKPEILTPQKLSAPVRNGFTLVEWGGLLRN
ncbi:MAG: hypothetical protein WC069_04435 [Candidatus Shapirobacteria bacterium]